MNPLCHSTVYENNSRIAKKLPFIPELQVYHKDGSFHLIKDPVEAKDATIIGMFVLRPGVNNAFKDPLLNADNSPSDGVYNESYDWAYNVDGFSGGWLIAGINPIDGYRLGMQYALSDAVIIGVNSVCLEGVYKSEEEPGYIWQPYVTLNWPSVRNNEPNMVQIVAKNRKVWQEMGYLSSREYPATIFYTKSGAKYDNSPDFLEATTFTHRHPNGELIEVYIMTSQRGAKRIKERIHNFEHLKDKIDDMLIIIPPHDTTTATDDSEDMNISLVSKILHDKYQMKIVNHDGGQSVLREFCKANCLDQMNLTLARQKNVMEVMQSLSFLDKEKVQETVENISHRVHYFFSENRSNMIRADNLETHREAVQGKQSFPREFEIVSIIQDDAKDDVAVYTFIPSSSPNVWNR